jgi:SAM-dependent methyltransferase
VIGKLRSQAIKTVQIVHPSATSKMAAADPHAPPPTQWTTQAYSSAAAFVPQLTNKVLKLLDPQPTDRVLDVGCGDAKFTARFLPAVASVVGVDASASFIATANENYGPSSSSDPPKDAEVSESVHPRFQGRVVDCRFLDSELKHLELSGTFDKVVSNAALHWILRDAQYRSEALKGCFNALKPGGQFVFEMGGAGNVAELHGTLIGALAHHTDLSMAEAADVSPWFFPDVTEMVELLKKAGFDVKASDLELEYRPTNAEMGEDGKPNLEGWVRLMGKQFLDRAKDFGKEDQVVREVCELVGLHGIGGRANGTLQMGYVRLRGVARRSPQ